MGASTGTESVHYDRIDEEGNRTGGSGDSACHHQGDEPAEMMKDAVINNRDTAIRPDRMASYFMTNNNNQDLHEAFTSLRRFLFFHTIYPQGLALLI